MVYYWEVNITSHRHLPLAVLKKQVNILQLSSGPICPPETRVSAPLRVAAPVEATATGTTVVPESQAWGGWAGAQSIVSTVGFAFPVKRLRGWAHIFYKQCLFFPPDVVLCCIITNQYFAHFGPHQTPPSARCEAWTLAERHWWAGVMEVMAPSPGGGVLRSV